MRKSEREREREEVVQARRRKISDEGPRRIGLASLLALSSRFSKAFLHFTRDRAGSWRLLRDLLGNLCSDGAQPPRRVPPHPPHPPPPPRLFPRSRRPRSRRPPIYNFSPLTCANFRWMRVSAASNFHGDSILRRRVVYHRRDRKNLSSSPLSAR